LCDGCWCLKDFPSPDHLLVSDAGMNAGDGGGGIVHGMFNKYLIGHRYSNKLKFFAAGIFKMSYINTNAE